VTEMNNTPKRLADAKMAEELMQDELTTMTEFVKHERRKLEGRNGETHGERFIKECVTVEIWQEADGTESVSVSGTSGLHPLEIKGVLHDGVYAIAHRGEPGFVSEDH
jgi:hypothetical protein